MGVFGGFEFGEDLYGPDVDIQAADLLTSDTIRIQLEDLVVIDDSYKDLSNYSISLLEGSIEISVRAVLIPKVDDALLALTGNDGGASSGPNSPPSARMFPPRTARDVVLQVDKIPEGAIYAITTSNLNSTTGQSVVGTAKVKGRRTKSTVMVKELPSHYDKSPVSIVCCLLTAIGLEDDAIGGSRDDFF